MGKLRPGLVLEQGRFAGTYDPEEEVLLEITVPLAHDTTHFRIGWSLKGLGHSGWIAISTGEMIWDRNEMLAAASHITVLLDECARLVKGGSAQDRR